MKKIITLALAVMLALTTLAFTACGEKNNDTRPVLHAEHARHIIEIMSAIEISAQERRPVELETTF